MGDFFINKTTEKVIWHKRLTKGENLACILKSAWIPLVICVAVGLILALTEVTNWGVFYFFLGIGIFTLLIIVITGLVQKPAEYTATTAGIICAYQSAVWQADYIEIESAKFSRNLFNKKKGKIKFKMKSGLSINYRFYMVEEVEEVYNKILVAKQKHEEAVYGEKSNKM